MQGQCRQLVVPHRLEGEEGTSIMAKSEFLSLEELAKLPVYPEPAVLGGQEATDGDVIAKTGYVYLIWENLTNYFKVGRTGNPRTRFRDLQTGNPRKLNPRFVEEVTDVLAAERDVKNAMAERYTGNLGGGTEWFRTDTGDKQGVESTFQQAIQKYKI